MNHAQRRAISELFAELFAGDNEGVLECLRIHPYVDRRFVAGLPPAGYAAPATFQWKVIERLESHGIVDEGLFEALVTVRPAARRRIAEVAGLFGVAVGAGESEGASRAVILMLSADAEDPQTPLRLGHEQRAVLDAMARAPAEGRFEVQIEPQVSYAGAVQAMVRARPRAGHFGGHGQRGGRVVFAGGQVVAPGPMADFFKSLEAPPEVVVFMCCDSRAMAEAVSMHVGYAIGVEGELGDRLAGAFSAAFYGLWAEGVGVPRAFALARNIASAADPSAGLVRLFGRGGVAVG